MCVEEVCRNGIVMVERRRRLAWHPLRERAYKTRVKSRHVGGSPTYHTSLARESTIAQFSPPPPRISISCSISNGFGTKLQSPMFVVSVGRWFDVGDEGGARGGSIRADSRRARPPKSRRNFPVRISNEGITLAVGRGRSSRPQTIHTR